MKHRFFGGIHPKYNKEMSTKSVTLPVIAPKQVVIPMQQHIGIPCTPLVKVGDRVLRGQKIGDGEGLCVPVHASVSGTVTAIEARPHPTLGSVQAVVIANDFQDEAVLMPIPETPEQILHTIREAGQALLDQWNAEAMWVDQAGNRSYSPGFSAWIRT